MDDCNSAQQLDSLALMIASGKISRRKKRHLNKQKKQNERKLMLAPLCRNPLYLRKLLISYFVAIYIFFL